MKTKTPSIKKTILKAWEKLPDSFGAFTLFLMVKNELKEHKKYPFDGTISRRLRELREDGLLDYRVIDNAKSIYEKINHVQK